MKIIDLYLKQNIMEKQKIYPEKITARIILKLKRITEDFCGHEINNAIITVTAYFNDLQR